MLAQPYYLYIKLLIPIIYYGGLYYSESERRWGVDASSGEDGSQGQ